MKKILSKRFIQDGGLIPWGYAVAYFNPMMNEFVAYPIGIHWIVKKLRQWYFGWLLLYTPNAYDNRIEMSYRDGFNRGRDAGRQEGAASIVQQLRAAQAQMEREHGNSTDPTFDKKGN